MSTQTEQNTQEKKNTDKAGLTNESYLLRHRWGNEFPG